MVVRIEVVDRVAAVGHVDADLLVGNSVLVLEPGELEGALAQVERRREVGSLHLEGHRRVDLLRERRVLLQPLVQRSEDPLGARGMRGGRRRLSRSGRRGTAVPEHSRGTSRHPRTPPWRGRRCASRPPQRDIWPRRSWPASCHHGPRRSTNPPPPSRSGARSGRPPAPFRPRCGTRPSRRRVPKSRLLQPSDTHAAIAAGSLSGSHRRSVSTGASLATATTSG